MQLSSSPSTVPPPPDAAAAAPAPAAGLLPGPRLAGLAVMTASGFAGLGYQIVWTQQAAVWLGHEAAAVLAVVSAFFGGLAVGAWAFAPMLRRSRRPARWYAGCELLIAAWSGVLAALIGPVSSALLQAIGAEPSTGLQWTLAFGGTFLLLLPATAAMGATLPAMERVMTAITPARGGPGAGGGADIGLDAGTVGNGGNGGNGGDSGTSGDVGNSGDIGNSGSHSIAGLYACNTLGATAGVLAASFWLVPAFGLARTAWLCAALNLACAAAALRLAGRPAVGSAGPVPVAPPARRPVGSLGSSSIGAAAEQVRRTDRRLRLTLAATGLLGIGYEVLVVRVLSQVSEDTVYTFALLLAVYLVGTALGAAVWQRWLAGRRSLAAAPVEARSTTDRLLIALALACFTGSLGLHAADSGREAVAALLGQTPLGPGMASALAAEAVLAVVAFGLPTVLMGMLFSQLTGRAAEGGIDLGRSLAVNTLGAALAPLLFGAWLVPLLGPQQSFLVVVAGYLALLSARFWSRPLVASLAVVGLAAASAGLPPLAFVDLPEGGRLLDYREGALAAVSVVEDAAGVSRLRIDNRQQEGSSATRFADARQALLPLLLHPAPHRALFLGLGTGITASAAARDPALRVEAVELLPEVIAASAHFIGSEGSEGNLTPRLRLIHADARRFMRASGGRDYDVVIADNFHPARSGSGALYTVEHFQAVADRLAPGGIFCQWLPLHQLDLPTLRSIVRSFTAVHPDGFALLATNSLETPVLGLIGRQGGGRLDLAGLRARRAAPALQSQLADLGVGNDFALLGSIVAGPQQLARFAADAPLNTDDRPVVTFLAPRITYAPDSRPRDRLLTLLRQLGRTEPAAVIDAGADAGWLPRLTAYWAARDQFLLAGRDVSPSSDLRSLLAQVREPLLAVMRLSPDFEPASGPLERMAQALAPIDPAAAAALRDEMAAARRRR